MQREAIPATGTLCVFSQLDNGIFVFALRTAARDAADEFLAQLEILFRDNEYGPMLRTLHDLSNGVFPLNYTMPRIRLILARYPNRPKTRSAMIIDGAIVSLVAGLIRLLQTQSKDTLCFFRPGMRDAAIEWLLSDE